MKPCLWTSMYFQQPPVEAVEIIAGQGWEASELSGEHIDVLAANGPAAVAEFSRVRERAGLEIDQCHCTFSSRDVASLDPDVRANSLALARKNLDICAELGISTLVMHPGGGEAPDRKALQQINDLRRQSFTELADYAGQRKLRIAIENMADGGRGVWGKRRFGGIVEEILDLIAAIGSPALGVCLDTSHANIMALNQPEAIRTCGEKLIALHISDNDGSGDQHKCPGYGKLDWPPIVAALAEAGFKSDFNLEIPGECHAPKPYVDLRSVYAKGVCEYLLG